MKKNLLTLICLIAFSFIQAQNVPNGGFESWLSGEPTSWTTDNIPPLYTLISQVTPAHTGSFAVKGEVVSTIGGPLPPVLASTDTAGNGFPVSQAYSTLSFYYKTSLSGTHAFIAVVSMFDALDSTIGAGGMVFTGNVNTFTLANVPIVYTGSNPVTCEIDFVVLDTVNTSSPTPGNYFIVDDVGLSGLASVQENITEVNVVNVYPNPASQYASVQYGLSSKSDVQFQVLNMQGKIVHDVQLPQQAAGKHDMDLNVASMPAGFYILIMKTKQGITFSRLQVAR
jgi:Secretion system C-terminal sorting domain